MSASVATELGNWLSKLREEIPVEFHHLVDEGHSIVAKLLGEAEADAENVAHDAEVAAGPILAEAESDAGRLAHDAVAEAEAGFGGGDKPSA